MMGVNDRAGLVDSSTIDGVETNETVDGHGILMILIVMIPLHDRPMNVAGVKKWQRL